MNRNNLPQWLLFPRSIAIVGFGREGKSTHVFLRKHHPTVQILIFDESESAVLADIDQYTKVFTGPEAFASIPPVDIVFKTPGIPNSKLRLPPKAYLTSQADLFVQMFGKQTIAITGTKGKSTTAHIIEHIQKSIKNQCILLGNIGKPALDFVDDIMLTTAIIFEMSSFQCESLHVAPHVAVFTSLYREHLDYYATFEDYAKAKLHLFALQKSDDICIYRSDDSGVANLIATTRSKKIAYSGVSMKDARIFLHDGWITYRDDDGAEERIIHMQNIPLSGEHMIINSMPGVLIAKLGLSAAGWKPVSTSDLETALHTIPVLSGRLELIDTVSRIRFYDDALATIPEATMAALDAFGDDVTVLIAGGHERDQDYHSLATRIAQSKITTLILFPTTGKRLGELVQAITTIVNCVQVQSMDEAIEAAYTAIRALREQQQPVPNSPIVLLSTAAPSFGLFADYADRSSQYKAVIAKLRRG
jgi:UDP-N-acetylmuramoyl-L-alanine---L-glutamate ligase